MRVMRTAFLIALGLVSGCGGCESCLGNQAIPLDSEPPESPATTATAAPLARSDAAITAQPAEDSGQPAEKIPPAPYMRDAGPLLRPKMPPGMALGTFQTCGVYDGPLCEKKCPKGGCRQECDGVACALMCELGYCSQLCGGAGKCTMTCPGGHCTQACTVATDCTKTCTGGSCD